MLGFFTGVAAFFQGVRFIARTPRLWGLALVPALTAMVLAVALMLTGSHFALAWTHRAFGEGWGEKFVAVGVIIAVVLLAVIVAISLAQPLSGWALEAIVHAQADAIRATPFDPPPRLASALRSAVSSLIVLVIGVPTIASLAIVGWVVPPAAILTMPLKLVVTSLLLAWDLLDYPMGLRRISLGQRVVWCVRHFGAVLGLGLAAALFFAIPGLGLLALPCGVAAATRLSASQ
jgi:CysZ protein